jgi:hypothetical protein
MKILNNLSELIVNIFFYHIYIMLAVMKLPAASGRGMLIRILLG